MRDITGIDRILDVLGPHWERIEEEFDRANDEFLRLASIDHDPIGRVLRSHLVVEAFLTQHLERSLGINDLGAARLGFAQKVALLPDGRGSAAFVKPGILELNAVRNKLGHRLEHEVRRRELPAIYRVLEVARRGVEFSHPVDAIEAFAPVACAFLTMPSTGLRAIFERAFSELEHDPQKRLTAR